MAVWGITQRVAQGVGEPHMRRPVTLALAQREWAPINPFAILEFNVGGGPRELLPGGGITLANILGPAATNLVLVGSVGFPCEYLGSPFGRLQPMIKFFEDAALQCNFRCLDNAQYNPAAAGDSWVMPVVVAHHQVNTGNRQFIGKRSGGTTRYEMFRLSTTNLQWLLDDGVAAFSITMTNNEDGNVSVEIPGWSRTDNLSYLHINEKSQTLDITGAGAFSNAGSTGFHVGNVTGLCSNTQFYQTMCAEQDLTQAQVEQLRHNIWRGYNSASRPQP